MALATKCPHCNTIFRVAHDQLKLRGGIVRCGACNEVFDGNAALVEPALKQPVIIELPASHYAAPTTSPELEALITTLDARHTDAPDEEYALARDADADADAAAAAQLPAAPAGADKDADEDADADADAVADNAAPGADDAFDLDLDVDLEELNFMDAEAAPASAAALSIEADYDAAEPAQEPEPEPQRPAYPPLSALDDEDAPAPPPEPGYKDGRREPTLDLPDEHLTAVALHDSFELDAYPHQTGDGDGDAGHEDGDEDVVTLSRAATGAGGSAPAAGEDGAGVDSGGKDRATGPATPVSAGLSGEDDEPGFVKRDRRRRQFGKAASVGMALGIPLLLAALAAQVVGTFRNPLAAAVPALKPALVSACQLAGCKVDLPAQIDTLSIEQGELQTLADGVFSFATTLRNQSRSAQAWPHMELILNDAADKPVLRRVLAPRDYLANPADIDKGFAPRSEQSVKLHFELAQVKASGYHIAVFYP